MNQKHRLITFFTLGLILATGSFLGIIFLEFSIQGKFPPKTLVAGVDLTFKTTEDAKVRLNTEKNKYFDKGIILTIDAKSIKISPQDLGVEILVDDTIDVVAQATGPQKNLTDILKTLGKKETNIPLLLNIDTKKLENEIEKNFKINEIKPVSATYYFDKGRVLKISEEKNGEILNKSKLINDLKNSAQNLAPANIVLELSPASAAITKEKLANEEQRVKELLKQPLTLVDPIYKNDWNLRLTDHIDWIRFSEKQKISIKPLGIEFVTDEPLSSLPSYAAAENFLAIQIAPENLNTYVDTQMSKWLDEKVEPVNIHKDEKDKIIIEGEGHDGKKIERNLLKNSIELALSAGVKNVLVPITVVAPALNISKELQALGVTNRVSVGHTSYYGSPVSRRKNIAIGASKFDGDLIGPGETFSFNKNLGPVDENTGFLKELVIKPEGTIPEYGGGLCQISTTFYRTILFGGYPVAERREHTYAVSYYSQVLGHGLDATIYQGGQDLKFKNDSNGNVLIHAYIVDDNELYVIFYGTPTGKEVKMEGPYLSNYQNPPPTVYEENPNLKKGETKQTDKPHSGFQALWYRHITDKNGITITEEIRSTYKAMPAKIQYGPGTQIKTS